MIISVVVPCYEQGHFLEECFTSILNQTFSNWECIIVNDGSNDNTEDVANVWVQKDKRFKYIFQENRGLSSARNIGIKKAQGEYILPLDADDKIGSDYFLLAFKAFQENIKLKVVYCKAVKFGEINEDWDLSGFSLKKLALFNMIFCSAFFKKKDWQQVGGYDVNMKYGWEDWEFWINILKNGGEVKRLDYKGFFYRVKKQSMITSISHEMQKELLTYINTKHQDLYIKEFGTYQEYTQKFKSEIFNLENKLQSRRIILNQFLKLFFKMNFSKMLLKE